MDNSRIRTGYDVEILLGEAYFRSIFQAAYDANQIPHSFTILSTVEGEPDSIVHVSEPLSVDLQLDDERNLTVSVEIKRQRRKPDGEIVLDRLPVTIELLAQVEEGQFNVSLVGFDDTTKSSLKLLAGLSDEAINDLEVSLRSSVDTSIDLDLPGGDLSPVTKMLKGGEGHVIALAIYLNLDLKIAPQSDLPESQFIARGNAASGVSFLPAGQAFAIGVSPATFERFANNAFHDFLAIAANGDVTHPVLQGDVAVGDYKSIEMKLEEGRIKIVIKFRGFVDNFPDLPVKSKFSLSANIRKGKLGFDVGLDSFDADAGILGDVIGYLVGGALAVLLIAIFGAAPVLIPILGGAGIAAVEILVTKKGDEGEDSAEEQGDDIAATVSKAFSAYPTIVNLFSDGSDPFFDRHFTLNSAFEQVVIDEDGMGMSGTTFVSSVNTFPVTEIIDKIEGDDRDSRFGLSRLKFRLDKDPLQEHELSLSEVFSRVGSTLSPHIFLKPVAIRSVFDLVKKIRFDTGVVFEVEQVVELQNHRVFRMRGFQTIEPEGAKAYVRGKPDASEENNLEALPQF